MRWLSGGVFRLGLGQVPLQRLRQAGQPAERWHDEHATPPPTIWPRRGIRSLMPDLRRSACDAFLAWHRCSPEVVCHEETKLVPVAFDALCRRRLRYRFPMAQLVAAALNHELERFLTSAATPASIFQLIIVLALRQNFDLLKNWRNNAKD